MPAVISASDSSDISDSSNVSEPSDAVFTASFPCSVASESIFAVTSVSTVFCSSMVSCCVFCAVSAAFFFPAINLPPAVRRITTPSPIQLNTRICFLLRSRLLFSRSFARLCALNCCLADSSVSKSCNFMSSVIVDSYIEYPITKDFTTVCKCLTTYYWHRRTVVPVRSTQTSHHNKSQGHVLHLQNNQP